MTQRIQLYSPVKSRYVTQGWAANQVCITPAKKIVAKRGGVCPAGSKDFYKSIGLLGHNGLDFRARHGEDVYHCATFSGWMKTERDFHGGIGVDVISNEPVKMDDGYEGYVKLRYWHLKTAVGHDGKQVKLGDLIGLADNTGASSGDHLHFALKKCDKDGRSIEVKNGFSGCFDPTPYMDLSIDAVAAVQKQWGTLTPPKQELTDHERRELITHYSTLRQLLIRLVELMKAKK